jgi:hypothetical protein
VRASGSRNHTDLIHLIFRRANVSHITGQWQDENFHTRVRIKASKDVLERAVLAKPSGENLGSQMSTTWRAMVDEDGQYSFAVPV